MFIIPLSKMVNGLKSTADVCLSCKKLESDYSVGISRQKMLDLTRTLHVSLTDIRCISTMYQTTLIHTSDNYNY